MSKKATVRKRPNLSSRRKSGLLPAVIYLGSGWMGQQVQVVPVDEWRRINNSLKNQIQLVKKLIEVQNDKRRRILNVLNA